MTRAALPWASPTRKFNCASPMRSRGSALMTQGAHRRRAPLRAPRAGLALVFALVFALLFVFAFAFGFAARFGAALRGCVPALVAALLAFRRSVPRASTGGSP